jgi:hypothetical protein
VIDEAAVALEILLVDVEARHGSEKPLEPRHAHDVGWRYGAVDRLLCDHD